MILTVAAFILAALEFHLFSWSQRDPCPAALSLTTLISRGGAAMLRYTHQSAVCMPAKCQLFLG